MSTYVLKTPGKNTLQLAGKEGRGEKLKRRKEERLKAKVKAKLSSSFDEYESPYSSLSSLMLIIRNFQIVPRFAYTAKYCADVGFDGVELLGAYGYLLAQFLSPATNKRTDQYGGSAENRARIVCEIYNEIRKTVPKEFVIGVKVNSAEFQNVDLNCEDALRVCKVFEDIGFDFIELTGGEYEQLSDLYKRESTRKREAFFLVFIDKIVKHIEKPVIYVTGGFRTATGMCEAVSSGVTQGIGLGRPAAQEPDLPKRILS